MKKEKVIPSSCAAGKVLNRKARAIRKLLKVDQGLVSKKRLPKLDCRNFRSAIRSIYPPDLTLAQELSIKTSQKVVVQCQFCSQNDHLVKEWEEQRKKPQSVDEGHLERFKRVFRSNVPVNWDDKRVPYIPNGHATLNNSTCKGGNWNDEEFSEEFSVIPVPSGGKIRIITLFSEFNVRT
ncbi:hypothetical protein SKA25_14675, partial [Enterococcus faecium]